MAARIKWGDNGGSSSDGDAGALPSPTTATPVAVVAVVAVVAASGAAPDQGEARTLAVGASGSPARGKRGKPHADAARRCTSGGRAREAPELVGAI